MAGYPELERLVRAAMVESIVVLDREAVLDNAIPFGYPFSGACRWCSTETHNLFKKGMRTKSMRVSGLICRWCEQAAAVCDVCNDTLKLPCLEGHVDG